MLYSSSELYYVARGDPDIPSIGPLPKRPGLSYILRPQILYHGGQDCLWFHQPAASHTCERLDFVWVRSSAHSHGLISKKSLAAHYQETSGEEIEFFVPIFSITILLPCEFVQ